MPLTLAQLIGEIISDTKIICDNCGWSWNKKDGGDDLYMCHKCCLLYTSPSPRDRQKSRMPSSA